jgi:hypothetical protein
MTAVLAHKKAPCCVANPRHTTRYGCGLRAAGEALQDAFYVANPIRQNKSAHPSERKLCKKCYGVAQECGI